MEAPAPSPEAAREELNLFPQWRSREEAAQAWWARAASAGLHVAAVLLVAFTPLGRAPVHDLSRIVAQLHEPFKLVAPPRELTQTAPNRGKVGKEFDLESLRPRPRIFIPPSFPPGAPPSGSPVPLPEPPKIETAQVAVPPLPSVQIQPEEKPKLTLPSSSLAEIGRELARGRGTSGPLISDYGASLGGVGESLNLAPSPSTVGNSLELLSDPKGVDFRPYMIQILAAVKRNWLAVIPQSAKLGARGRVAIQFIISRDGSVPKLVIASPSGLEALDRAAVAGISASNPFPPLPAEFSGINIRLQLVFLYNMRPN